MGKLRRRRGRARRREAFKQALARATLNESLDWAGDTRADEENTWAAVAEDWAGDGRDGDGGEEEAWFRGALEAELGPADPDEDEESESEDDAWAKGGADPAAEAGFEAFFGAAFKRQDGAAAGDKEPVEDERQLAREMFGERMVEGDADAEADDGPGSLGNPCLPSIFDLPPEDVLGSEGAAAPAPAPLSKKARRAAKKAAKAAAKAPGAAPAAAIYAEDIVTAEDRQKAKKPGGFVQRGGIIRARADSQEELRKQRRAAKFAAEAQRPPPPVPKRSFAHPGGVITSNREEARAKFFE
eukprot:CAMPEP_0119267076 /NCGR_PEP_ID=MMETSP1329-20130426/5345_1 /TAXON_ID=114041 /ORGANISM="Genus nov. species nov., Strain RCC1024" /LENGTH=298 /DNA_ID=CAMNT_0007266985 /DNA_START=149 /DNA_END=1042 /DNA_ORIENTATION=+